jgi:hypothetical protein
MLISCGELACRGKLKALTRSVVTAGSSSKANNTVRSKPCGPVMTTRTPPRNGSAAIHPWYCSFTCCQRPRKQPQSARGVWKGFPRNRRRSEAYGLSRRPPGRALFANRKDEDDFGLEDLVQEYPWALRSKELIAMVWDGFVVSSMSFSALQLDFQQ